MGVGLQIAVAVLFVAVLCLTYLAYVRLERVSQRVEDVKTILEQKLDVTDSGIANLSEQIHYTPSGELKPISALGRKPATLP
jgi:hypothetical protein